MSQPITIDMSSDVFKADGAQPIIGSDTAVATLTGVSDRSIVVGNAVTPINIVNGVPIGRAVGNLMMVWVAQLRLPDEGGMRRDYRPDEDPEFEGLKESIRQTNGCNLDPMLCEVTDEMVEVEGVQRPILIVRAGQRRYWALVKLGSPEGLIRVLPREAQAKMVQLVSLITNEMREPLGILDKADIVTMLIEEYGMTQRTVGGYVHYSQSRVSRLNMLSHQPPRIKTFVSNETLDLDVVEQLNKRFRDDEETRVLAARYIVQHNGAPSVNDIANQVAPPIGSPTAILQIDGEEILLVPIGLPVPKSSGGANKLVSDRKPEYYWTRRFPLRAQPLRIITNHKPLPLTGDSQNPQVAVKELHVTRLFEMVKRQGGIVDIAALEEAMLSDLESIREGLERLPLPEDPEMDDAAS